MKIDKEFRDAIAPLDNMELGSLEDNVIANGCRDPFVVWDEKDILLDGHHRHGICKRNEIDYPEPIRLSFKTRADALDWMYRNQLGRRNLSPDHAARLRGLIYNRRKSQGKRTDLTSGNNCPKLTTAEILAEEFGVSPRTIKNDGALVDDIEIAKQTDPDIERKFINGEANRRDVRKEAAKSKPAKVKKEKEFDEATAIDSLCDSLRKHLDKWPEKRRHAAAHWVKQVMKKEYNV